jgi:arabinogalactan oligomer/maltooligosaccharide transport system substrate-binding protein
VSPEGAWDPDTTQLASERTTAVLTTIQELRRRRILRTSVGPAEAEALFIAGKVPFLISSSGPAIRALQAGISVAVSEVPGLDERPTKQLVAVYAFYIAAHGRNRLTAQDLIPDYLSRPDVIERFGGAAGGTIGTIVPLHVSDTHDPLLQVFHRMCMDGEPMASFDEIDDVWKCVANAELSLLRGRQTASSVADELTAAIHALHRTSRDKVQHFH